MALNFYQYTKSADKYGPIAQPQPVKSSEPGLLGNMGRSAASGTLSGVGGIFDMVGATGVAKQFYGWSDDARQSMSAEAQTDMAKPFFSENDQGEIQLGEGLTDLDTWLLTMANVAGQFAPTAIPGAGLANAATKALKLGETGAKIATAVGMGATGGASATGQGMEQARQEWKQMPDELKLQSDLFKNTIREMKQKQPDLDGEALWTAAEDTVAERLASEVQTDPKVLMANFAGSAIADPIIGRALTGARLAKSGAFRSAAKGFAIEGSTEAGQAAVQEYGINQALSQVDGRDPMDGVAIAALNEGVAGGTLGAAAGGVGGLLNRKQAEPVKDPEADAIRDKNPDLASAFDSVAQSAAQREADLQSIIGGMPAISQPALEGELLDPEQLAGANYNPNQIGMQARISGPTIPRINQKDVIFAADGRTEAERNPAMEGEWLSPEQRAANTAGFIENAPIDLESEQVKQAKAEMERMRNEPRQITDKNVIFAGDGRPQQAAQEFTDNLQRQANQAASVPRLPQKDIIFAGDQSGVRVKGNGEVYKSPREAMTSKQARAMKRSGTPVEAVQFGDGWGWRVKESQPDQHVEQAQEQPEVQPAQEVQPAPVQMKKSGDPFKTEKEMKISASYKAAATTGAELETVPVDGGFGFRVKPEPARAAQLQPAIQARPTGKQAVATTPAGRDIDVEYQVVEADSLVTSNLEDGRSNPDFPAELQPRDRSRAASQDQINRIAGAVNPRLLAESATTSDGAPIISADGIVESGNGRSLGLRKAYRQGGAEGYRQFLTDSGFDIEGMKQPVLVRVRRTELSPEDRLAYIKESNQRTTLEMSATEQAASDAAKMSGVVADYQGGEITSAENRSFVRKFMQNVAGEAERGGLMDSSGVLSQNGRRRIEAALLSAAYGDDGIVAEVFESGDTDIKAIGGALLDAAGKWAQMRNAERDGMIADGMDVTPFLLEAVNLIRRARGEGKALIELVSTDDIFSGSLPDATRAWLSIFYRGDTLSRARGRDKVAEYLIGYANEALKTQPGDGLFGDVVTSDQVMGALNERITNQEGSGAKQGGLFTTGNADNGEAGPGTSREGQGSSAERANGPDREQPEKSAVAAEPTTQTPADAGVSVSGPVERIDDFGEKLGGARKDVWGGFSEAVSSELDTRELPLSKSFPEPDYVKMAADGVSMETLAIIAAMRSEIPAKPRVSYKVRRWAEKVDVLRNFARDLIGGELTPEQVIAAMSKGGGELQAIADAIPAIAQANPETIKLAAKYRIGSGTFSIFRGKQYSPSKTFYYPQNGRSEMLDLASPDKQGALDNLVKLIKVEAAANPDTAGQKQSKISIYSDRYTKQAYLGWAGGSGVLRIQNFDTVNEAREYLKSNRADVEAKLKQLKQVPEMRRPENRKRVGPPRYAGSITPAIFADTFGFRGVEFGNWVEQGKRQKDLNEAYDALMDLADVLGVPPKALALNGELGMAFGARGKGAATTIKAAAHYETSYVAINLTKESGSGSLAHEWWHSVDNYFARLSGNPNSFVTEGGNIRGGDMRQEVRDAFTSLIQAIRKTKMFQRASTLDSRRSKAYWSSEIEASARSFETFIIAELEAKGFSNDYLANVVDPDVWGAIESAEQTYPYPTTAEQEIINPAFRSFFDTLQTKETDKGVMLFSKQNTIKAKPAKGVNAKLAKQFIAGIMQRLNGAAGIKVVVLETQAEAEKLWQMSLSGDLVRGAYNRATNTAYVIAENIKSMDELREVVAHEVIGHGGLQNVISKSDYAAFIDRLKQTRSNPAFAEQWAQIDNDYEGFSENDKAEELFAYFVQNKPVTGPVKLWFNALKRFLHKALVSVGLAKAGDPDIEAMQDMLESIRSGFMFGRSGEADSTGSELAFSKARTTEQADALDKLGLGEEAAETVAEQAKRRANETVDTLKSSSFWKRLNEGIFDGLAGIKQAEEAAGITDPNKQGYVSARLASGLSDILHGVFHYGAPEWRDGLVQRKADTKGLLEVFGMLGDDLNDWLAWMGANRAERLMAEGRENNLSQADIDELKAMAAGKEALFEQVRQEYNKINSSIIDLAEEAGLLSAEQRGGFDEEWYVPFFRNMEEEVDPEMSGIAAMVHGPRSRKGIAGQSAQIKELKGGRQSTKDLLENIIHRQSTMIDAAIKNKAMAEVVSNLEGTPFMQAVDSPDIAALSQTELNLLQKVKVMRNGKAEAYTVTDPALLRGLLQIHTIGNQSLFNRMARSAKRFLTAGITLSPDFIIKNFVRDAAHAWMINKDGFRFGADSVKGLRKAFAEDEAYRDLIFSGAAFQGGYVHGADPEAAAQQIRRALRSKGLGEKDIQSYMDSLITKGGELLEAYRTASDKVENANRLSTYEAALESGKSRRQAAYEAKDLMDYSLKGNFALIGTMIDMLPFFNARLQGMSKLVRAMKAGDGDRVLKVLSANLAMKGLKVAAFSLALAAMNDDDERYQELPDWDKDANWHFFIGDEHFRIPKPFELGILFGTMPERMFHYAAGSQPGGDLGKAAAHAVWNTLALNPIPQLALPVVEVMTNKSFFKGSQIEGMGDAQRQPEDRYNAYTSETAKQIGAAFGVSPKMVEHLILGYTGTLGGYVLGMSDIAARQMLGIEAADTPISRYPVIKAFYQGDAPKTATKFQDEFYKALEESTEAYGSYKRAVEEGDVVRQQDLKESESQALGARVQLNRIQRKLSELNKQAELVNNNQNISGAEKRQKLDDIAKRKNALYQNAYVRHKLGEW
ncbi:LPD38 domain-containing protein [Rheinheimera tilapiae]|uniref:LPD38 domain-containing protein n=1 Tax=Rheinheimera tilapiae TaxID=875043 RepID=A0ABV6BAB7_9GAMM